MAGAVCYIRVSTTEQASDNNSLPVQERKLREYCGLHDIPILKVFVDPGESARTTDRPEFQKMLAYCRQHRRETSHLIVSDLSRLTRNAGDQALTLAILERLKIKFVSVDEPITSESAAGKLAQNMLGAYNQFFSDSLSERTRDRMRAGVKAGRFLWPAPIGYLNVNRKLCADPERAPLVREAFELIGSGRFSTTDAVLKLVTAMGLTTQKGRPVSKQTFARMLSNPVYSGWVVSGDDRVRGIHEPLVSDNLFQSVQERVNGKSTPHKKLSEDFPLRGLVRCATCGNPLTAAWAKGRSKHYARYWCWASDCRAVGISREDLEGQFVSLLSRMQPTAESLAQLPELASRHWEVRKALIAADERRLKSRLADQKTMNQRALMARLKNEMSPEDLDVIKQAIDQEIHRIQAEISALDSERNTMDDLGVEQFHAGPGGTGTRAAFSTEGPYQPGCLSGEDLTSRFGWQSSNPKHPVPRLSNSGSHPKSRLWSGRLWSLAIHRADGPLDRCFSPLCLTVSI